MNDVVKAHAVRAHRKVRGHIDLDDLMQVGMVMAWRAAQSYNGEGTLEGWIHSVLWRGYRDVVRGVMRNRKVIAEYPLDTVPEPPTFAQPDDDLRLKAMVKEYENRLTPRAYRVLLEMVHPGPLTMREAFATNLRRKHIKKQGVRVEEVFRVTVYHVARGLNLPLAAVERAVTEIRKEVRKDYPGGVK